MLANSEVVCIIRLCFEHTQHFHIISHTAWGILYDNWLLLKAVNNALTSYIKLCNYVILNSNEPIKVAHLQN